jgi:acetyltransferase-like isoleucine patch superfamily enzyme
MTERPYQNFWGKHEIGEGTKCGAYVEIGDKVKIGKNCLIEAFAYICPLVTIEDNCFIGPHTTFTNDKRPPSGGKYWMRTLVKNGASIGANSTILPGITIGENAVVGSGSVVTKDIPRDQVWCGNPAKMLRKCIDCTYCGGCDGL